MAIYTYEVDHGDDEPRIHAGMEFNGGKLIAVQFDSAMESHERIMSLVEDVTRLGRNHNFMGDHKFENAVIALEIITKS